MVTAGDGRRGLMADADGAVAGLVIESGWGADLFDVPPRLVPSSPELAQVEPQMALDPIRAHRIVSVVPSAASRRISSSSTARRPWASLTVNGLFAADHAVIVTEPSAWAVDGVAQILRNVARIAERRDGSPSVAGIVVNRLGPHPRRSLLGRAVVSTYPDLVVRPAIAHKRRSQRRRPSRCPSPA